MPVRRRVRAAVGALSVMLLAGCGIGPSTRPDLAVYGGDVAPAVSATDTPSGPPLGPGGPGQDAEFSEGWRDCEDVEPADGNFTVECAGIRVPLDYSASSSRTISIEVGRAVASNLPTDAPPLIVLMNNGPYDATLATIGRLPAIAAALPAEITDHFAIVAIDIRGTGESFDADCFGFQGSPLEYLFSLDADPRSEQARANLSDISRFFTFACQDTTDAEMVFFSTTAVADDLDSVRSALGLPTLDLLGVGYGATVGAVYAQRYPGRVGRFVLDSPADSASSPTDRAVTAAVQYERAWSTFAADCAATSDCALGADPAATLDRAFEKMAAEFSLTSSSDSWFVNSGTVLWAMVAALPERNRWPALAEVIGAAADGDPEPLTDLVSDLLGTPAAQLSTRLQIACNDTDQRISDSDLGSALDTAADRAPLFGPFLVGVASFCRQWPTSEDPLGTLRAPDAPPLLVIGGTDDPIAPYAGVRALANQLASATLISYAGNRHGGYPASRCISQQADAFLLDGTLPTAGTLCAG